MPVKLADLTKTDQIALSEQKLPHEAVAGTGVDRRVILLQTLGSLEIRRKPGEPVTRLLIPEPARLSSSIFWLLNLGRLLIVRVNLLELPAAVSRLRNLWYLNVSENGLTQLPDELMRLTRLERLDVSKNQIWRLPEDLGRLTWLTVLTVTNNPLICLPASIGNLQQLTTLEMSHTHTCASFRNRSANAPA